MCYCIYLHSHAISDVVHSHIIFLSRYRILSTEQCRAAQNSAEQSRAVSLFLIVLPPFFVHLHIRFHLLLEVVMVSYDPNIHGELPLSLPLFISSSTYWEMKSMEWSDGNHQWNNTRNEQHLSAIPPSDPRSSDFPHTPLLPRAPTPRAKSRRNQMEKCWSEKNKV